MTIALPPVIGGLEHHAAQLSIAQAQRGSEIHLVFARGKTPDAQGISGHRIATTVPRPGERSTRVKFRFMLKAWPTLWRLDRSERFDLIDAQGDFVEGAFAGLLGRLRNIPSVLTIHGGLNEKPAARFVSRACFRLLTHIIAVSDQIREQLLGRGVPPSKISVISSGVDLSRFPPPANGLPSEVFDPGTVLFVGRLHRVKGVDVLLQSVPLLTKKRPNAQFVICGDGTEAAPLKQNAAHLENVRFEGALPPDKVASLMRGATVFVQPSVPLAGQSEGQPRAIMEAMAAGLPIVASRTGGIPELFEDGVGGRLVPPGDPQALADALVEVLSDPEAAREMGRRNRERIQERDFSKVEEKVTALFERLIAEHKTI